MSSPHHSIFSHSNTFEYSDTASEYLPGAQPVSRSSTPASVEEVYRTASESPSLPPLVEHSDDDPDFGDPSQTPASSFGGGGSSRYGGDDENMRRRWGDAEETETTTISYHRLLTGMDWDSHQNLGTHLMNAHLLKKLYPKGDPDKKIRTKPKPVVKARKRRHVDADEESDIDDEADSIPLAERRFITNQWTAWPLSSEHVPRQNEHDPRYRRARPREAVPDEQSLPSQMLEEVLTATVLRRAKERIREEGKPELKPTVDDDEAQKFLRPVVRNIISKLDTLLVGLHKEREHYVKNLIPSSARGDAKRKWDQLKSEAKTQEDGGQPPTTPPRTALSPTPADTEEDLDSEDSEEGGNNKKRKRKAANPGEYEKYLRNRRYRVRLRDWSQVVGMAAIKGWEQGPLERTAAKCAELFAQDMKFRTLGTKSKRGTEWTAKGGLSEDSAARDGGSFLEEVCVSWGHQKSKISAKKDSRRLRKQTKGDTDSVVETGDGASPSPSSEVNGGA